MSRSPMNLCIGLRTTGLRKLLGRRTMDAYGVQILTDQHLTHAQDLSNWHVQDLGSGRHLVQARDLNPWYTADAPDPRILDQARHDFGDLILNPTVAKADLAQLGAGNADDVVQIREIEPQRSLEPSAMGRLVS